MDIKSVFKQLWLWRKNRVSVWIETIVVTFLALCLCYLMNPQNPLFFKAVFPWPWIVAIIVVLQYGFGPGLLAVSIIAALAVFQRDAGLISFVDFQTYVLSGITITLIGALFSSSRVRRMINAEEFSQYTESRLDSLSRSYYMLRISYDYLEHNVITKPITIRAAIGDIQQILITERGTITFDIAYRFLQLINQYCSTSIAGLYLYDGKKINTHPIAEIGVIGQLDIDDPLISKCIDEDKIYYVTITQIDDMLACKYLVAAPLQINDGETLGIIVIKEMPFFALNHENLRTMSILIAYFSQEVSSTADNLDFLSKNPSCPASFAKEFIKSVSLKKRMDVDSALVAVIISKSLRPHNVLFNLKTKTRHIDSVWDLDIENYDVLITLMPFTDAAGIEGYMTRIRDFLEVGMGIRWDNTLIKTRSLQIYAADPLDIAQYFLDFIGRSK